MRDSIPYTTFTTAAIPVCLPWIRVEEGLSEWLGGVRIMRDSITSITSTTAATLACLLWIRVEEGQSEASEL